jgi:hypothetical protein
MAVTLSTKATYAIGAGAGFVGIVLAYHQWKKYRARKKFEESVRRAVAGEVSTRSVLEDALAAGQITDPGTGKKIIVRDDLPPATRLSCEVAFPAATFSFLPGFAEALAEMRRKGTCT